MASNGWKDSKTVLEIEIRLTVHDLGDSRIHVEWPLTSGVGLGRKMVSEQRQGLDMLTTEHNSGGIDWMSGWFKVQ